MKLKSNLIIAISFTYFFTAAQVIYNRVQFAPTYPTELDQTITINYNVDTTIFYDVAKIKCHLLFLGINKYSETVRMDFPQVFVSDMTHNKDFLSASFSVPNSAMGIVAIFLDSLGEHFDNNNGEGYWIPFYNGREPIPGAISCIADVYAGGWDPEYSYHLKRKLDVARSLYERDFERNPQVKRNFNRYYLATFDLNDENDTQLFRNELYQYSQVNDLSEWELLYGVSHYYGLLNELDSAIKYRKLVFERYPNGSWALQTNSLKPAMEIEREKDYGKKKVLYNQFKETYCQRYPDEFTRFVMEGRKGHILQDMILSFVEHNELNLWLKEVDQMDEEFKCYAFARTSKKLIDIALPLQHVKQEDRNGISPPVVESNFFTYKIPNESNEHEQYKLAEKLSELAIDWWRKNMNAPRRFPEKPFQTDEAIAGFRKERLAEYLDNLGQSLLLQNKFGQASEILKEAVLNANRKKEEINEHYIESLVKSNQTQEALYQAEIVIRKGKSTAKINNFHKGISTNLSPFDAANASLKKRLLKNMISEEAPNIKLMNDLGKIVDLKTHTNKIIVIDFWATWCPPCIAELDYIAEVVEKYKEDDVAFIFVNVEGISETSRKRAARLLKEKNLNYDLFFDPEHKSTLSFKVNSLPTTLVIDRNGKVRFRQIGLLDGKQEQIDELVAMIEMVK